MAKKREIEVPRNGWDGSFGIDPGECVVPTVKGQAVVFESYEQNPSGTSYVRFVDLSGRQPELLFYNCDEWQEEPELVMGCIMAAIQNGAKRKST